MKRNILYLLLLIVLGGLVYYFVFIKGASTLGVNERNFSIADTSDISRIFIADMKGNKIEAERKGNVWMVNNKFPARKDIMDVMLSTFKRMTVRYPVPESAINHVVKDLSSSNKKVEVYNKNGDKIKSLYIGSTPLDNVGNYMLVEGARTPFVVEIPGFNGILDTRFVVDETEMRTRNIITIPFPSLAEIKVDYTDRPDSSFAINVLRPDSFLIYNPAKKTSLPSSQINKDKVFTYIDFLKQVNCEGYANDIPTKDSIMSKGAFCTITLTKRNNTQEIIKLYRRPIDRRSKAQADPGGLPLQHDLDRFYGLVNDGKDFVLLQEYHFGRLLKNFNYFKK